MTESTQDQQPDPDPTRPTRRKWLGRAAIGGAAVVGGVVAGGAVAVAQDSNVSVRRESVVFDVACLGDTFREQLVPDPPEVDDNRGSTFSVEGWIYPGETILGEGFVPTENDSIGRWFCSGFGIANAERPIPHVNSTANFVLGTISEDRPFPPDNLVTTGLGVAPGNSQQSQIPIIGGSGKYFGALGQGGRITTSFNTTLFFGTDNPSPNFRYTFEVLLIT